jgi:hypothetical protein
VFRQRWAQVLPAWPHVILMWISWLISISTAPAWALLAWLHMILASNSWLQAISILTPPAQPQLMSISNALAWKAPAEASQAQLISIPQV